MVFPLAYKILYFVGPEELSDGYRAKLQVMLRMAGLSIGDLFIIHLAKEIKDLYNVVTRGSKQSFYANKAKTGEVRSKVDSYIARIKPDYIVVGEPATCYLVTRDNDSVSQCRGSVYRYGSIGVSVVDNIKRIHDTPSGNWVAINDWKKVARFITGNQFPEPKFNYTVCKTREDLFACQEFFRGSFFKTIDSETIDNWISCIGYTGAIRRADGTWEIHSWVIPFWNPTKHGNAHWRDEEDEVIAWEVVREIHASRAVGILQNGHYDAGYFIRYHVPVHNYFVDTMHLWHCVYAELPKRLDFITSVAVDHCVFWKEETKGEENETGGKLSASEKIERYWRYCALDCYYTTLSAWKLLPLLLQTDWAQVNYCGVGGHGGEFSRQIGPCMAMEMRGILLDDAERQYLITTWTDKLQRAEADLKIMCDEPTFSFASPKKVARLFYEILGAKPVRFKGKEKGTGEVVLKMLSDQHRIIKIFADKILACREAKTLLQYLGIKSEDTKNQTPFARKSRIHYSMNAAGTYTSRLASGTFQWEGINGQNIGHAIRSMFVADDGWILFDIDLEQSDARFVAYESEEPKMIAAMESGKDTHCYHAAHFFREPYDYIMEQVRNKVPKYADKVFGMRNVTKKIVHGSNYAMAAYTLYQTIVKDLGKEAVIQAAIAIGYKNARHFSLQELVHVCHELIESYHDLYPGLRPWSQRLVEIIKRVRRLTNSFGWTNQFFGDPANDDTKRAATAFMGQSDTGGCINRALDLIFYAAPGERSLDERGVKLLLQVHDSIVGMVRKKDIALLAEVARILELPISIHSSSMRIPAAIAISERRWGDANLKKVTPQELEDGRWEKLFEKKVAAE